MVGKKRGKEGRREKEKSDLIESLPRITWSRKLKPTIQVSYEPKNPTMGGTIGAVLRADPRGPLEGPLGGSEDRKDVRTESANRRRNSLALEKGRIKHSGKYWAPQGMTNITKETKKLSGYAGW